MNQTITQIKNRKSVRITVVAAESLGIGSCYIGDIIENYETVSELLELPDYVLPAAMVVYGYPTESQKSRKKPIRFEKKYIVFENKTEWELHFF